MRPPDLREVSAGLAVVQLGFRLVSGAVWLAVATGVLATVFQQVDPDIEKWSVLFASVGGSCFAAVLTPLGLLVGFAGRLRCLETPAEWTAARSRVRLAVLLEGCGLLCGVVNAVIAWAVVSGSLTVPVAVLHTVFGFALLMFVAGRVFFFAYLRSLVRAVGHSAPAGLGAEVVLLVAAAAVLSAAIGAHIAADTHPSLTNERMVAVGVSFVVAAAVFVGLNEYGRMLRRLRGAVTRHMTQSAGHPE